MVYTKVYTEKKEDVMMNCNWIFRDLMTKKRVMRESGIDVTPLDNEKKVNEAFKKSGLVFPVSNKGGRT